MTLISLLLNIPQREWRLLLFDLPLLGITFKISKAIWHDSLQLQQNKKKKNGEVSFPLTAKLWGRTLSIWRGGWGTFLAAGLVLQLASDTKEKAINSLVFKRKFYGIILVIHLLSSGGMKCLLWLIANPIIYFCSGFYQYLLRQIRKSTSYDC